jgi:hypothetical protein
VSDQTAATERQVTFVPTISDAPRPRPGLTIVVLDASWTPRSRDRADVLPVRRLLSGAIEERDLVDEALTRLDAWAEAARLPDLLVVEGTTYWFRMRETMWRWLHERLLWCYALPRATGGEDGMLFSAPRDEAGLLDVLGCMPAAVLAEPPDRPVPAAVLQPPSISRPAWPGPLSRLLRLGRAARSSQASDDRARLRRREAVLDERIRRLSALRGTRVAILVTPSTHQHVGSADAGERRHPQLGSVIPRLGAADIDSILVGIGLDHRDDADWHTIEADDSLLPQSVMRGRWGDAADEARIAKALATCQAAIESAGHVPLDVGGIDLGPSLALTLASEVSRIVTANVHQLARVERFVAELRPDAILLTQEGIRTPWLMAAARAGVPTFAIQHGVLYATHPGYPPYRHPAQTIPTRTFVYGDFERRVLLEGAYVDSEVEVSGSPRLDLDEGTADGANRSGEREAVRRELGVRDGHRLLVVSTLHLAFIQRSHFAHMIERVLGGPLPGVHVVFKQHPGERDDGPYRSLIEGLAGAGGYEPPPITVVRDIDLYRLLRAADAHLGLHSTVLTDAVAAGTSNLIAIVEPHADLLGYVAAGVARPVGSVADLAGALADPRPPDPAARQAFLEDHFRAGEASGRIAESISGEIRARRTAISAHGSGSRG